MWASQLFSLTTDLVPVKAKGLLKQCSGLQTSIEALGSAPPPPPPFPFPFVADALYAVPGGGNYPSSDGESPTAGQGRKAAHPAGDAGL